MYFYLLLLTITVITAATMTTPPSPVRHPGASAKPTAYPSALPRNGSIVSDVDTTSGDMCFKTALYPV